MKTSIILFAILLSECLFAQSTITLQPGSRDGKDAEIGLKVPNTNYGNSGKLSPYAWTHNSVINVTRGLIEFDLSIIPSNSSIISAKLTLYHNPNYAPIHQHSGVNSFLIQKITSSWIEDSVTWSNQPTTTIVNQVTIPSSTVPTADYVNMDVTNLVQDMLDNPATSHGFMLKLIDENPYAVVILASSDNIDSLLHPKLEIVYNNSVNLNEIKNEIQVYPNPTKGKVNIALDEVRTDLKVSLINIYGQVLLQKLYESTNSIDLDIDHEPGLYFLQFESPNRNPKTIQIIKE